MANLASTDSAKVTQAVSSETRHQSDSESAAEPKASANSWCFIEEFSINTFLRFYSFMKKDSSPQPNFFFFNRAWPEAQKRRNKHILGQQGSCWAWSFLEEKPIRRASCVERRGLGLEINIRAEFPVQWHYKWCWTPLTDMPAPAPACQTENSHKDLYAASQITLEMLELSQCGVDF